MFLMGNTSCCCVESGRSNRVLPTTSTVLAFGVGNRDIISYRRHRKRDDYEPLSVAAQRSSSNVNLNKRESLKTSRSKKRKPDKEMKEWLNSILIQNNLLPSKVTFDDTRHRSMRASYSDVIMKIKQNKVILESVEDDDFFAPVKDVPRLKKMKSQLIQKALSDKKFNLGLGPALRISTRISKDAVKRNRQKDSKFLKSPPPPRRKSFDSKVSHATTRHTKKSKEDGSEATRRFHVSSDWLDEDFNDNILNYPTVPPQLPQHRKLSLSGPQSHALPLHIPQRHRTLLNDPRSTRISLSDSESPRKPVSDAQSPSLSPIVLRSPRLSCNVPEGPTLSHLVQHSNDLSSGIPKSTDMSVGTLQNTNILSGVRQSSTPLPGILEREKRSAKFKIERETSEPAVQNLGVFLSAADEDPEPRSRDFGKKKCRPKNMNYRAQDEPMYGFINYS